MTAKMANRNRNQRENEYTSYDMGQSSSDSLLYESQNNMRMEELASKVSQLHKVTLDIHGLVEDQNAQLDDSQATFDSFGDSLKNTHQRVKNLLGSQNRRMMLYTVLLILFVILVIYFLFSKAS